MSRPIDSWSGGLFRPVAAGMFVACLVLGCAGGSSESDSGSVPAVGGETTAERGDPAPRAEAADGVVAVGSQESPVGCWTVHVGDWADAPEEVDDAWTNGDALVDLPPTWTVRLDSAEAPKLFQGAEPGRVVDTYLDGAWRDHPFQRWRVVNDSIVVDHPAAFSGTTLRVVPTADGLEGVAVAHSDVPPEGQLPGAGPFRRFAAVRLVRAECPE